MYFMSNVFSVCVLFVYNNNNNSNKLQHVPTAATTKNNNNKKNLSTQQQEQEQQNGSCAFCFAIFNFRCSYFLSQLLYCTVQLQTVIRISYNTQTDTHIQIFYMLLLFVHGTCCDIKQKENVKKRKEKAKKISNISFK